MATAGRIVVWVGLAALPALLAVVGASTFTVFDGPGCTGNVAVLSCGSCHNIEYSGGYYFLYTGGNALLYDSADCADSSPATVLTDDTWYCSAFSYKGVAISCSSSHSSWDITAH